MSTQIIDSLNGKQTVNGPLTLESSAIASPGLLSNAIDSRIVKIRPMSTPIDQLSRCGDTRKSASMTVEYYTVDRRPTEADLSDPVPAGSGKRITDEVYSHTLRTGQNLNFSASETIIVPDILVTPDGKSKSEPLVFYVASTSTAAIEAVAVNAPTGDSGLPEIPAIPKGTRIVRMGRAAAELDVQSPQFQPLPHKAANNCQIFKMQVEESTFHKIANKEIGWNFSDQEEAAIADMRLGMEKNFLFGARAKIYDFVKQENIYLTGGIWGQTKKEHMVLIESFSEDDLLNICREAFTGNSGSKRKILIAGTKLIDAISRVPRTKIVAANDTTVKWGVEFREIRSNFGSLFIVHSEIFDSCGHAADGMVIDPDFLTKYVHVPFNTEKLDLRRSGQRNTSAVVITEASCLVLRYPDAHLRIVGLTE